MYDYELILQRVYKKEKGTRTYIRTEVLSKAEKLLVYFQEDESKDIHRGLDFIVGYSAKSDTLYMYRDIIQVEAMQYDHLLGKAELCDSMLEDIRHAEDKETQWLNAVLNVRDSGYFKS